MQGTVAAQETMVGRPSTARRARRRWALSVGQSLALIGLIVWTIILLFPAYWMVITAFKGPSEVQAIPPSFWVKAPTLDNFTQLFDSNQPIARWLWNSAVVSVGATVGVLVVCSLAGYSFARKRFRGRDTIFWALIATMLIPGWTTLVPLYVWTRMLDLHNTYWVLILPGMASPFAVFLCRQFIVTLPGELFDAARVDGCSELGLWARIVLPLSKPVLAVLGIFTFIAHWNDFLWPLVVIDRPEMFTIQVGVVTLQAFIEGAGPQYGLIMATALVLSLPPIVAFLVMQRYLVQGLTIGALKG